MNKKKYLEAFDNFLNKHSGKCHFKTLDNAIHEGWIIEILDNELEFAGSGPLSQDPYILALKDIDVKTLSFWDDKMESWRSYSIP